VVLVEYLRNKERHVKTARVMTADLGGQQTGEEDLRDDLGWPCDAVCRTTIVSHDMPHIVTITGAVFQSDARKRSHSCFQLHHSLTGRTTY